MTLNEVSALLLEHDNFEILTHNYPDGDCLGCGYALCLGLRQLGKNARVITTDKPKSFGFITKLCDDGDFEPEYIVSTDVADEKLLGKNEEKYTGRIDLCIDHHGTNKVKAAHSYVEPDAAAAGEIIYELLRLLNVELTVDIANCLYTALSTDTGCFCYTNTTSRTLRIAADLLDCGCDYGAINKIMFETKSKRTVGLEREILDNMRFCCDDKCAIIYTTLEMVEGMGDDETEGLASIPRRIEGVAMGITVREKPGGEYKVSVRTTDEIDACEFCRRFGGGGHPAAAGCTLHGTLESVIDRLVKEAEATV
jgi:phosphoesterase RecJ-like protein